MSINRREFLGAVIGGLVVAGAGGRAMAMGNKSVVSLVKTTDREKGISEAIKLLGVNPVAGKQVLLKPNFNTADPFPASTHNDTLRHLIGKLKDMDARSITIGERSGPPDTEDVLRDKGIRALASELGVGLIDFEQLPKDDWVHVQPKGSHWQRGFYIARPVVEAECVVSTCCLKTHAYGGVFTMALKLSVGVVHKSNMTELHTSFLSQRDMIAEINAAYSPSLIVMDAIKAFTDGGPMEGELKRPGVIVAGSDPIAIDAVGLAILKEVGSNAAIMNKPIFKQDQVRRAVELELGVSRAADIELRAASDSGSMDYVQRIGQILEKE